MGRRQAEVQLAADFGEQAGANPRCLILFCPPFPATDVEETQKALRRSHLTQGLEGSPMWRPLRCRDPESQDIGRSRARSRVNTALGMERYWHYPESPALEQFLGETQPREWGQARSAQVARAAAAWLTQPGQGGSYAGSQVPGTRLTLTNYSVLRRSWQRGTPHQVA